MTLEEFAKQKQTVSASPAPSAKGMTLDEFARQQKQPSPAKQTVQPNAFQNTGVSSFGNVGSFLKKIALFPSKFGEKVVVQPAIGALKELGNQAVNVGELGAKGLEAGTGTAGLETPDDIKDSEFLKDIRGRLEGSNLSQRAGGMALNFLEYALPAGKVAQGAKTIDTVLNGTGILSRIGRVGSKALLEGAAAAPIATAQTGSVEKGAAAGLLTAGLSGAAGSVGEAARAAGIPEKIYQKFFKSTADDEIAGLKASINQEMKTADPEKYARLLDAGIIKEKDGNIVFNASKARKALDAGLKGSIDDMAKTLIKQNYDNELSARAIASAYKKPITLEPNYKKTLDLISEAYKESGLGQVSARAASLSSKISADGSLSATDALEVRRFLDGMRMKSSFDATSPLPLKQENLKELTDALRGKINSIPGMDDVMSSYSTNIDLAESLSQEAARVGNKQVISLLDTGLLGGGFLVGQPVIGLTLGGLRRAAESPRVMTNLAQEINKSIPSAFGGAARGTIGSAIADLAGD